MRYYQRARHAKSCTSAKARSTFQLSEEIKLRGQQPLNLARTRPRLQLRDDSEHRPRPIVSCCMISLSVTLRDMLPRALRIWILQLKEFSQTLDLRPVDVSVMKMSGACRLFFPSTSQRRPSGFVDGTLTLTRTQPDSGLAVVLRGFALRLDAGLLLFWRFGLALRVKAPPPCLLAAHAGPIGKSP